MKTREDIENIINNRFGLNTAFVIEIYENYLNDKNSVSDYWNEYFNNLSSDGIPEKKQNISTSGSAPKENASLLRLTEGEEIVKIIGVGTKLIENMESSLQIPTATSLRTIPVKLLEENRRIINHHLTRLNKKKISYSHIVAYSIVYSLKDFSSLNNSFAGINGQPHIIKKENVNLGIAIDIIKKDNSRSLIVPNIKKASEMNFAEFCDAYNEIVEKARSGRIEPSDFEGTTISLTNPGGLGTVSSSPRLMNGQGCILAIGAIDYPSEFQAMQQGTLAYLGIGKVMNITNTYDHRIIQGAESGLFLKSIDELLKGNSNFYINLFEDLNIPQRPVSWDIDSKTNTFSASNDIDFIEKQSKIPLLINFFRVRGHLTANLNPLSHRNDYYSELDPAEYGFTIWDYDREFFTNITGYEKATLREILDVIGQTYSEMIGAEYMHIQSPDEKLWLMNKMEQVRNKPNFSEELKKRILENLIIAEGFEHFLHTRYIGHKRFSLEGSETLIPVLDHLLNIAADSEVEEACFGMAHRGRLNVLANIIKKSYEIIFSEFEDAIHDRPQGTGDVKYHLGASGFFKTKSGKILKYLLHPIQVI